MVKLVSFSKKKRIPKMNNRKEDNVVIVFEAACDAHWMKDVVQFPNALAHDLLGKRAILIARANS